MSEFDFTQLENIEVVYHLAATRINRCAKDPNEGHKFLADAGLNVVKYCAENNVKLFFSSTASVYNNPKRFPIEETDPCEPHTLYGSAKYYTENLMRTFANSHGLQYSICRFFSVYGVRMDCEGAYTEIIYNWLSNIHNNNKTLTVYGDPDEKILDLVYVEDVVNAALLVIEKGKPMYPYNIGSGEAITVGQIVNSILKATGKKPEVIWDNSKPTTIPFRMVSTKRITDELGFVPSYTFDEGIDKTVKWYRQNYLGE